MTLSQTVSCLKELDGQGTHETCCLSAGLAREKQKAKLQAFCRLQTELWSRGWFLSASQATAMILHSVHSQRMRGIRETSAAAIASGKNPAGVVCMVLLSELQRSCGSASDLSQDIRRVKTQDLREFCSPFATGLPKPKTTTPPVLRPTIPHIGAVHAFQTSSVPAHNSCLGTLFRRPWYTVVLSCLRARGISREPLSEGQGNDSLPPCGAQAPSVSEAPFRLLPLLDHVIFCFTDGEIDESSNYREHPGDCLFQPGQQTVALHMLLCFEDAVLASRLAKCLHVSKSQSRLDSRPCVSAAFLVPAPSGATAPRIMLRL